jgi:hypothetical protein
MKATFAEDKKLFLANLAADVAERRNQSKEHPEVVQQLLKLHQEWAAAQWCLSRPLTFRLQK